MSLIARAVRFPVQTVYTKIRWSRDTRSTSFGEDRTARRSHAEHSSYLHLQRKGDTRSLYGKTVAA